MSHSVKIVAEQEEVIRRAMEEQSHGSRKILESAGMVGEVTRQVKGASAEMLEGSRDVIMESRSLENSTHEITRGINEMANGTEEINRAVNAVNELSSRTQDNINGLLKAVSQFKV